MNFLESQIKQTGSRVIENQWI